MRRSVEKVDIISEKTVFFLLNLSYFVHFVKTFEELRDNPIKSFLIQLADIFLKPIVSSLFFTSQFQILSQLSL